ncbi:hypothetical protein EDD22DRAFT_906736 [Suillus occidentalis]|nr:hypothetical protein EDD22DRAFT_906736 [Suillus occidentalis]
MMKSSAAIGYPPQGLSVSPGSSLTVQVERPVSLRHAVMPCSLINAFLQNSLTGSEEVAVVIGIQSCPGTPCIAPADYMGQILYNGPFSPQYHETYNPPYENFTVQIPSSIASGTALLGVAHVTLVGVSALSIVQQCSQLTI